MGKGGALTTWLKEFTNLVFVQTLHAFIFAVIISVIMTAMDPSRVSDPNSYNVAIGVLCVVALTSLFKVEELSRKIFGLGETKADHKGALKSIAKTAVALKIGKRALDNTSKITGGASKIMKGRKDIASSRKRAREDADDLENDRFGRQGALASRVNQRGLPPTAPASLNQPGQNNVTEEERRTQAMNASGNQDQHQRAISDVDNEIESKKLAMNDASQRAAAARKVAQKAHINGKDSADKKAIFEKATKEALAADKDKLKNKREIEALEAKREDLVNNPPMAENQNDNLSGNDQASLPSQPAQQSQNNQGGLPRNMNNYNRQLRAMQRNTEKELKDARALKTEGIKEIIKGTVESGGAVIGATTGAILGGADGNLEETLQGLSAGAGIGDAAGELAVNTVWSVGSVANSRRKAITDKNKRVKEILKSNKNAIKEAMDVNVQSPDPTNYVEIPAEITRRQARSITRDERSGSPRKLKKELKERIAKLQARHEESIQNNRNNNQQYSRYIDDE